MDIARLRRSFQKDSRLLLYRLRLLSGERKFDIRVRDGRVENGTYRIEAEMHGQVLWIESAAPLVASPEAFVCAYLFHAMMAGQPVSLDRPLDRQFKKNLDRIQTMAIGWWPKLKRVAVDSAEVDLVPRTARAAVFFTAGVDSYTTLRRNLDRVDSLINIAGFDIPNWDTERLAKSRAMIARVGKAIGKDVIAVATNMRSYLPFRHEQWEVTHLAKIGAIAHALSGQFSKAYVASSDVPPPWGSHRDLDPLWSSSALALINDGAELSRLEKVRTIYDWDIVPKTIKVCWENRAETLNCGACEKCVRTQLQFLAAGASETPETFPKTDLRERIDSIPRVAGSLKKQWVDIEMSLPAGPLRAAIQSLLKRS
jgi:hypothetical protein